MGEDFTETCTGILKRFPAGIVHGFAYGSGVFKQSSHKSTKENMIDFIFVVDDALHWHSQNLKMFPSHYSFLRFLGPHMVNGIQRSNLGAKVYFNTLVQMDDKLIKYGVVSKSDLVEDLDYWNKLYLAGRLHKPVLTLTQSCGDVRDAIKSNLQSALTAALLLLPKAFSERDLFITIAGLSYQGDFRMVVGEDRKKVENIVDPNIEHFHKLYSPFYNQTTSLVKTSRGFEQDLSYELTLKHLSGLPVYVKQFLPGKEHQKDVESTLETLAYNKDTTANAVARAISSIVLRSSMTQSLKGIATAGLSKTIRYSSKKLSKMIKGFLR